MADLTPPLFQQFFDSNGDPLAGGKVFTYVAGSSTPTATYKDRAGTPNTNPILLDANGSADIWIGPGYFKFVVTDADDVVIKTIDNVSLAGGSAESMPSGGLTGQVLKKKTDADFDTEWADESGFVPTDYAYDGYSARFNENFVSTDLDDTLKKILNFSYLPPLISLSGSSNVLREKGDTVSSVTLTAALTKRSDPLAEVRFYLNPSTLLDTQTSGGGLPNGGNSTYVYSAPFSDTLTFRAEVDDDGATGGPTTVQATATYNFVFAYLYGCGAAGLSDAAIAGLTKLIENSAPTKNLTFTPTAGQVFYFAQPSSYPALTNIVDLGTNLSIFNSFSVRTANLTNSYSVTENYRIYEFTLPQSPATYNLSFRR